MYIVERTNKAEIRPEEQTEKAETCRENLWMKYPPREGEPVGRRRKTTTRTTKQQQEQQKQLQQQEYVQNKKKNGKNKNSN